jgi:hypothetical protein
MDGKASRSNTLMRRQNRNSLPGLRSLASGRCSGEQISEGVIAAEWGEGRIIEQSADQLGTLRGMVDQLAAQPNVFCDRLGNSS